MSWPNERSCQSRSECVARNDDRDPRCLCLTRWPRDRRSSRRTSVDRPAHSSVWRRLGFTLMELLVVVAIIATLAAVVAPAIFGNVSDAKLASARSQIEVFGLALSQYRLDNGVYPTTEQGLAALRILPTVPDAAGNPPPNWRGPYLTRVVPLDPWGKPYVYLAPGRINVTGYDLYTLGRDGLPGGTGEDSDVTSWGGPVEGAGTDVSSAGASSADAVPSGRGF